MSSGGVKKRIIAILILMLIASIFSACSSSDNTLTVYDVQTPTSVYIEDGVLMWTAMPKADNYLVKIIGGQYESETVMTVDGIMVTDLQTNVEYKVSIASKNFWARSEYSQPFTFTILPAPDSFMHLNDTFYWVQVEGASAYNVYVNGEKIEGGSGNNVYYSFAESGEFQATIQSVGDGVTSFNSTKSQPINAYIPSISWEEIKPTQPVGNGSEKFPYKVSTVENIKWLSEQNKTHLNYFLDKYIIMTNDIDFKYIEGYEPIGSYERHFLGSFDGCGYGIANLKVSGVDFAGVFGVLGLEGTVQNLNRIGGSTIGVSNAGGIVARNYSMVYNCSNSSKVEGRNAGGIVGENTGGMTVLTSTNYGEVSGNYAGGIVGSNWNGYVSISQNYGEINGINLGGGIVGSNGGSIDRAVNYGEVKAYNAGGIVGSNMNKIIYVGNYGFVQANEYGGGLVGTNDGEIINSYNIGEVMGDKDSKSARVGGIVGRMTEGQVSSVYSTGNAYVSSATKSTYGGAVAGYYRSGLLQDIYHLDESGMSLGNTKSYIGNITIMTMDEMINEQFIITLNEISESNTNAKNVWVEGDMYPTLQWTTRTA